MGKVLVLLLVLFSGSIYGQQIRAEQNFGIWLGLQF